MKYSCSIKMDKGVSVVDIYQDGVWAGKGGLHFHGYPDDHPRRYDARIVDCPADLDEDVYDMLDDAITEALLELVWNGTEVETTVTVTYGGA